MMPFSHVRHSFQPEQLANLTEAFNLAWPQIMVANRAATDVQLDGLRQRLANFIVACASRGEFDPQRLRDTALRAFNARQDEMAET
jgi:hypothetical protein